MSMQAIDDRIAELKRLAAEEGIVWSGASEQNARAILEALYGQERPALVVTDDGILRATWRSDKIIFGISFEDRGPVAWGTWILNAVEPVR